MKFDMNRFVNSCYDDLHRYARYRRKRKGLGHVTCVIRGDKSIRLMYTTVSSWALLPTEDENNVADQILEQFMQSIDHDTHFVMQVVVPTLDRVWYTVLRFTPSISSELTPPA